MKNRIRINPITIFFLSLIVLLLNAKMFSQFIVDDTFISLRYSERLLNGDGLTWNDGEMVEGYSNLLWVLLTALVGLIEPDLVKATHYLGYFSIIMILCSLFYLFRPKNSLQTFSLAISALIIATTGSFAAWANGGLEAPLVGACLSWGIVFLLKNMEKESKSIHFLIPGLFFALICITRPDGPLFTVLLSVSILWYLGIKKKPL